MAKTIIEITPLSRGPKEYRVFDSLKITIGRSYDNDLIVYDQYVSPEHAIIHVKDDGWEIEDRGNENKVFVNKHAMALAKVRLSSGDEITIGKTILRVLSSSHPVEATLPLASATKFIGVISKTRNAWCLLLAAALLYFLADYLKSSKELPIVDLSLGSVFIIIVIFIASGIWGFIGHLIKNKSRFVQQLSVFSIFFSLLLVVNYVGSCVGYLTSSIIAMAASGAILLFCLLFFLLTMNLRIATNISHRKCMISGGIICFFIIAVGILIGIANKLEFNPKPEYYAGLKPPFIKIVRSQSIRHFLTNSEKIFKFEDADIGNTNE